MNYWPIRIENGTVERLPSLISLFLAAAVLLLRPPLPGHRAEDAQDVVRVPAHAAQGVRRQLRERHPQGADHHRRHRRGSQQHRHPDHGPMRETERCFG